MVVESVSCRFVFINFLGAKPSLLNPGAEAESLLWEVAETGFVGHPLHDREHADTWRLHKTRLDPELKMINLCGTSDAFHWQNNKDLCKSPLFITHVRWRICKTGLHRLAAQSWMVGKRNFDWGLSQPSNEAFQDSILEPTSIILNLHVARSGYFGQASHHLRPNWHTKTLQVKQRTKGPNWPNNLFHLSTGVLGLSKQTKEWNALRSGSGVALWPASLHDPDDSCRFRWLQVFAGLETQLSWHELHSIVHARIHVCVCRMQSLKTTKQNSSTFFHFPTAARIHC